MLSHVVPSALEKSDSKTCAVGFQFPHFEKIHSLAGLILRILRGKLKQPAPDNRNN